MIRMDGPKFDFFKSESKWLQSTSIAAYIIGAAALLGLIMSGWMVYGAMYSDDASGDCYFKGNVKDSKTKEGLPGVNVSIKDTSFYTYTNGKGDYEFNKTPAGKMTVVFTKAGYRAIEMKKLIEETDEDGRVKLETISLSPFETNKVMNTIPSSSLQGTIFSDISNSTVEGAAVSIQGSPAYFDAAGLDRVRAMNLMTATDADGGYHFAALPAGVLELRVLVEFNETYSNSHHKVKNYEAVLTFMPEPGSTTVMDYEFDDSAWAGLTENLVYPFTYMKQIELRPQVPLTMNLQPDAGSLGLPFEVSVHVQGSGVLVSKTTGVRSMMNLTLPRGIYMVVAANEQCRLTVVYNVSLYSNATLAIPVLFGKEPLVTDKTDIWGYYQCAIINILLACVALVGAFFCFTRKKYLVAMVGAMACVLSRSPMEIIPGICNLNMILGIIAFLFIFRSRDKFLDAPPPQPAQGDKGTAFAPAPTRGKPPVGGADTAIKGEAVRDDKAHKVKGRTKSSKVTAKKN